ncbi:uncharacterized protein LOC143149106 [Ptiloglossa arizonensis]|uniref:uncharacterized protein LOC143149106 n=1 Tax=Ptiloglossa arizonensis TaxID=3350558 RepID=UPI003FA12025
MLGRFRPQCLLAISVGEETISTAAEKVETSSGNGDDIVMLEIDVKEPVKRSPISAGADYGAAPNQYVLQNSDDSQQLSPEYLSVLQQYGQEQPQVAQPQRRPQPAYARQQQALQQAYYNYRKPTVVPPRPRTQLHPQALAQAEVGPNTYQEPSYAPSKLGTFEQELLQLVSANQAQEFKLLPTQPKGSSSAYSQQLVSYPVEYAKPTPAPPQLPEQYHIETSPPRYQQQQQPVAAYQSVEEPVQYQTQSVKPFNPSPQYDYQAEAQAQAQAQAHAEAQALAFQKYAQSEYDKHKQASLAHIGLSNGRYRQESALEQIQQGAQVSDAGRNYLHEQLLPKNPEAAYKAKLKAQSTAETAEARKLQQAAEFKAHADAIHKLEAQQRAHIRVQEEVHNYALNFEKNQARAQAIAQAQAEALYKIQQERQNEVKKEILAISKGQVQGKKVDPESPLYQFTLSNKVSLPLLNNYFGQDQLQKYQASGSSHVPRSVPKPEDLNPLGEAPAQGQPVITQPRQTHKLKIPSSSQAVYVSDSGLLKKSPIKSLTIEEVDPDQINNQPVYQAASPTGRALTEEDLSALINAGYTVSPVSQTAKPDQVYAVENLSAGYYPKKQKTPALRPEYATYEEVIQRPRKLIRKNRPIPKHNDRDTEASGKVTYLVPLESSFGTRQPPLRNEE